MLWQTLSQPWQICITEAWTAYCAGSIPIGAVIADSLGNVLARGRNCVFELSVEGYRLAGSPLAHAELNALLNLKATAVDTMTCTLFTTMEPCPMCLGALRMHRVRRVSYAARDPVAGSLALVTATPFMQRGQWEIVGAANRRLEQVLIALHTLFAIERNNNWINLAETHDYAQAVQLGRRLCALGTVGEFRTKGTSVAHIVDELGELVVQAGG
jgi:tRNA(adenine34) deaminase